MWLLWVALSVLLGETFMSLFVLVARTAWTRWRQSKKFRAEKEEDPAPPAHQVPHSWWIIGLIVSTGLCVSILAPMFSMPVYEPVVGVAVALLVSILAVRSLGETDINPAGGLGKVSQFIFASLAPGNLKANLIAGAVAEAGALQAGDMMQDLKTGHLIRAFPRAQFYGQMLGSLASVFLSTAAYMLYTHAYKVPGRAYITTHYLIAVQLQIRLIPFYLLGPIFPVPSADIWLNMARFLTGHGPGVKVASFCIGGAILAACLPIIAAVCLAPYLPSGVALGVYLTSNWTMPRAIGGLLHLVWLYKWPRLCNKYMILVASGFVLGEGILSFFFYQAEIVHYS
jgi:uncharacterized oligopeptide transporter (OPT) family protein